MKHKQTRGGWSGGPIDPRTEWRPLIAALVVAALSIGFFAWSVLR